MLPRAMSPTSPVLGDRPRACPPQTARSLTLRGMRGDPLFGPDGTHRRASAASAGTPAAEERPSPSQPTPAQHGNTRRPEDQNAVRDDVVPDVVPDEVLADVPDDR